MKVVHLSHTDGGAGAGRAAYRIHRSMLSSGVDSTLLVSDKRTLDATVISHSGRLPRRLRARASEYIEAKIAKVFARDSSVFISPSWFSHFLPAADRRIQSADVVSLFWVNGAYISPEGLVGISQPIVWRLSDVWPFTGGCHYPGSCDHFEQQCGHCPQLNNPSAQDISHQLWQRKAKAWQSLDITIVAPSEWIASLARRSSLFSHRRVEVIPTGIDLACYRPRDRNEARGHLGIPIEKKILVFGAMSPKDDIRKGFKELSTVLEVLANGPLANDVLAVVFGSQEDLPVLPVPAISLGRLESDESLALAYSCADMAVVPSLQDNLPNVALEAIACGTPVAGFDVGGMAEIVRDGWNGILAPHCDPTMLGHGIAEVLSNNNLLSQMRINARLHAETRFSIENQARAYLNLYTQLTDNRRAAQLCHDAKSNVS